MESQFKIIIDAPSEIPALRCASTAQALSALILASVPRFAVGIFGGWGTGKTTLIEAIKRELADDSTTITVDFNAWRFEQEPQLLVPLLDSIRHALMEWAARRATPEGRERLLRMCGRIAMAIRTLSSGLTAQVGLPGAVSVAYDAAKASQAWAEAHTATADTPQSRYLSAFMELVESFTGLQSSGVSRIVVFVDDLDRCVPSNALVVLESMKLFFDLPGFVFVAGLDELAIRRAVRSKFGMVDHVVGTSGGYAPPPLSDSDEFERSYVRKIFQVPYHLPRALADDLDALLSSMCESAHLELAQREDLHLRVRPHLEFLASGREVNPREVKRYVNAYTIQTSIRPDLDREIILGLQTLLFRDHWNSFYGAVILDSTLFLDCLRRYRAGEDAAFQDLSEEFRSLPADLARYLRSDIVSRLGLQVHLDAYLSSLESTRTGTEPNAELYRRSGELRAALRGMRQLLQIDEADTRKIVQYATALGQLLISDEGARGGRLRSLGQALVQEAGALAALKPPRDPQDAGYRDHVMSYAASLDNATAAIYQELRTAPEPPGSFIEPEHA